MNKKIVRCISCEGFGWFDDPFEDGEATDCDWCDGIGYVYRLENGQDQKIPPADFEKQAARLEELEQERLREMGYEGQARRPWEQDIRKGTRLGQNPGDKPPA
ncbi:hypothetical protein MASR2M15_22160 [Anaerolineales bacterium]